LAKRTKTPLAGLKESLESKNASFDTKILITSTAAYDVCSYAEEGEFAICLLEMKQDIVTHQSMGTLLQKGIKKIEEAFNWDTSNAHIVNYALQNLNTPTAVLVDKTSLPNKIESILFVYNSQPCESFALEVIKNILKYSTHIQISVATEEEGFLEKHNINSEVVKIIVPQKAESSNLSSEYDLIIIGTDRSNRDIYDTEIIQCEVPVLLLYPPPIAKIDAPPTYVFS